MIPKMSKFLVTEEADAEFPKRSEVLRKELNKLANK